MKDLMIVFASLLLILILISAFGGGMMVKEPFSDDASFGDYGPMPQPEQSDGAVEPAASAPAAAPDMIQDASNVESEALLQASSPPLIEPFQGCLYAGCMMTP